MKFSTETHVPFGINCNHFGEPLTFHFESPSGQIFNLLIALFYYQITCRTNEILINLNCTLYLVLISECLASKHTKIKR